jgi:hypothetical protein
MALEDLYRGRLSGPVRAQQGEDLTGFDVKIDPFHGLERAVRLAQISYLDGSHGRRA